jgi:hypothetical protein
MWPKVHIKEVGICSMCVSQVEGVYMDPIKVRVHREANLWQAQRNLVGTNKCEWMDDLGWFPTNPSYCLLRPETQEQHLALAHKPNDFHPIVGLCSSWCCFLFLGCRWGEWDSCPFHHRDQDTYATLGHAPIWSQQAYFYVCHIWHQWCEIPFIHIDGVWFSSHKGGNCLVYHELANMWRLGGMVECPTSITSLAYARLDTIMFQHGWCPTQTPSITVGCTLIFYFLFHYFMFWYYFSMGIP